MLKWQAKNTHIKTIGEIEEKDSITIMTLLIGLICVLFAALVIRVVTVQIF